LLRGLDAFEGRSSLKTWLFRILVNQARTTGTREHRTVPVADPEPAVDPARSDGSGGWADPPEHWIEAAEDRLEAGEFADRIRELMHELPARQRGRPPARRGGDDQRGGLLGIGHQRREPAGPAAPRP
jgi:RNA polymerase sigma-70 factor (ECF subfamily)